MLVEDLFSADPLADLREHHAGFVDATQGIQDAVEVLLAFEGIERLGVGFPTAAFLGQATRQFVDPMNEWMYSFFGRRSTCPHCGGELPGFARCERPALVALLFTALVILAGSLFMLERETRAPAMTAAPLVEPMMPAPIAPPAVVE